MKSFTIACIIGCILSFSGWYWYEFVFPISEFSRLGEIKFPNGTKALEWHGEGWGVKGQFQIPADKIDKFETDNSLSDGGYVGSDSVVASNCIHDDTNLVKMSMFKGSGIVDIEIQGPDLSGDKPCSPDPSF